MSKEVFTVYHCRSCNKIEVTQYISKEQMEELGFFRGRTETYLSGDGKFRSGRIRPDDGKRTASFFLQRYRRN